LCRAYKKGSQPADFNSSRDFRLAIFLNRSDGFSRPQPGHEKLTSTNTIESQETKETEARKPRKPAAKKVKTAKKARETKKFARKLKADRPNKKTEVIALMKRARRDAGRDHGRHRLAGPHCTRLRQHPWQQGRSEDRVREERRWRTHLPYREVGPATLRKRRFLVRARGGVARCVGHVALQVT
jgi:hypothetical protein